MLSVLLGALFFINKQMGRLTRIETDDTAVWDSLQTLLRRKDENTLRLLRMMSSVSDSLLTYVDIDRIVEHHDTVVVRQQVTRRMVTRRDTIHAPVRKKKGFFKRLGEAFAPPKEDTTIQIRVTTEVATDTVTYDEFNPLDSLKVLLQDAARDQHERAARAAQRKRYLGRMDRMLSTRIDSLLKGYEQQVLADAHEQQQKVQVERIQAARTVGGIAVGGVALAAVFLLLIGRDVARANRYRRQTDEARERAEQLLATRERLMLALTHDFKAPLGTVKGYAELLERLTNDPRQRFYLKGVTDAADHLTTLVTDLLEYHRLERGAVEVTRVAFCPARLMEEVAEAFRPQTVAKGLQLFTDTDSVLEGCFVGAPLRIRRILDNLMGNAVKFTERGSVTLRANYDCTCRQLVVVVEDTGPGMTTEELQRIWEEFARLPGAQGKEGCGLGLSIVRLLVELLEGKVEVDSKPGRGSRFTVSIPLYPVVENGVEAMRTKDLNKNNENGKAENEVPDGEIVKRKVGKLLLIDDDRLQLQLTRAMLQEAGIEAVACLQVDDVLEALRSEHFDALLTDIQMPAISGVDLLRLLRASEIPQAQTIPVVAVTARADTERTEMVSQGFAGLLHKPFGLKELAGELDELLPLADIACMPSCQKPDFAALTAYSGDDPMAACDILQSFVDETHLAAQKLRAAGEKGKVQEVAAVAHKLIPLFVLIGADQTVNFLRKLESLKTSVLTKNDQESLAKALDGIEQVLKEGENIKDDFKNKKGI